MKKYYRLMLGKKSKHAAECFEGGFIGAGFGITQDLAGELPDEWRTFNAKFIPVYLAARPGKTKIGAGLACGALWTVSKGIEVGDVVLSPDGTGQYRVGEVTGPYYHQAGHALPHRRPVHWTEMYIDRDAMSDALKNSTGSIGTVCEVTKFSEELAGLMAGQRPGPQPPIGDPAEDPTSFAMEKHLEDFLVANWAQTELGKDYDIYVEEDEMVGQQYQTDTGPIDVLAISKDKKRLLVVELKKGRPSDAVVGQIMRYMGYVQEELCEEGQTVVGAIIALDDSQKIRRALSMISTISFYRYQVSFKLVKG
ncbi:MAG: endonuclease NucS domain-containing protein [Vicinamibacterales bacterium]